MTFGQRVMLLLSLFFFFGTAYLSVVDFGGKKTAGLITGRSDSVLQYPEELRASAATIPCYTADAYDTLIRQAGKNGYTVRSSGQLSDGDVMKIWAKDNGDYFVIVEGPDQSGTVEGCQVTEGWNLQAGDMPANAVASAPAAPETGPETAPAAPAEPEIESPPTDNLPEDQPPSESLEDRESRAPSTDTDPADPAPAPQPESDPAPRSE